MNALHLRLTLSFALLLLVLGLGLLLLLGRSSDRYADEAMQRLNAGIAMYVVRELPLMQGDTVTFFCQMQSHFTTKAFGSTCH